MTARKNGWPKLNELKWKTTSCRTTWVYKGERLGICIAKGEGGLFRWDFVVDNESRRGGAEATLAKATRTAWAAARVWMSLTDWEKR
jgi:hypothetical protein